MPAKNIDMSAEHVVTYLAGLSEKRLSRTIRAWCADYGAGIVQLQRHGLEKRVKHYHNKRLVKAFKQWNDSGREYIISPPELKAWVLSHRPSEILTYVLPYNFIFPPRESRSAHTQNENAGSVSHTRNTTKCLFTCNSKMKYPQHVYLIALVHKKEHPRNV
jgi:hypothetical protein